MDLRNVRRYRKILQEKKALLNKYWILTISVYLKEKDAQASKKSSQAKKKQKLKVISYKCIQ